MSERPAAVVVHAIRGRMRLRVPACRGDDAFFRTCLVELMDVPGVTAITARPETGSLLLLHEGTTDDLVAKLADTSPFVLHPAPPPPEPLLSGWTRETELLDRAVRAVTRGRLDLNVAMAGGLLALAAVQAARGQVLGPAVTLALQAAGLLGRKG